MKKTADNEGLLWLQFKNGDREAFASIYRKHIFSLIAYGSRLCPEREALEDSIHELFVELWNTREHLSPTDSVKFYLFKALRYKLIRYGKRHRLHIQTSQSAAVLLYRGGIDTSTAETEIILREEGEHHSSLLQKAIQQLTHRQREAIRLRYYQGFDHQQIAELMDMHYQSVSNLLYSALRRLKESMKSNDLIINHLFPVLFFFSLLCYGR